MQTGAMGYVMPDEAFVGRSLFEQTAPAGRARRALCAAGFRFPVDVLPTSSTSFEAGGSLVNLEARREGIVLYDARDATDEEPFAAGLPGAGLPARRG